MSLAVVSGAGGFIAQHVVGRLLKNGYKVVGTAMNQEEADRVGGLFNDKNLTFELVPDIAVENSFDALFEKYNSQIKFVLHTASPCRFDTTDYDKEILIPATNGVKSVFEAIRKYSPQSVERVILTSSLAATVNPGMVFDPSVTVTEESWNPDTWEDSKKDPLNAYFGSKVITEKFAWDFLKKHRDEVKFQLTTVNPGYVFGPQYFDESVHEVLNASCEIVNAVVKSKPGEPLDSAIGGPYVDVRDIARAHADYLEDPRVVSKRLLVAESNFSSQVIADIINANFPELKGKISEGNPGTGQQTLDAQCKLDNSATRKLLGFELIPLEKSIIDTVTQILKARK